MLKFRVNAVYPDRLEFFVNDIDVHVVDYEEDGSFVVESALAVFHRIAEILDVKVEETFEGS